MRRAECFADVTTIDIRIAAYNWDFIDEQKARIDTHWDGMRATKPTLFDGRVLVSHRMDVAEDRIDGLCFETRYRNFISWRDFGYPGAPVMNAFAMPALLSADGAFMLGEMSATTANGGRLYFPAGTPEPADADREGRVDFEANILRELEEETGLTSEDVRLDVRWTAVFDGPLVAFMKMARSPLGARELQARLAAFNATHKAPELTRLVPVRGPADYDHARMPRFMLRYLDRALAQAR